VARMDRSKTSHGVLMRKSEGRRQLGRCCVDARMVLDCVSEVQNRHVSIGSCDSV
jgi:hypothetical protein